MFVSMKTRMCRFLRNPATMSIQIHMPSDFPEVSCQAVQQVTELIENSLLYFSIEKQRRLLCLPLFYFSFFSWSVHLLWCCCQSLQRCLWVFISPCHASECHFCLILRQSTCEGHSNKFHSTTLNRLKMKLQLYCSNTAGTETTRTVQSAWLWGDGDNSSDWWN